MRALIVYESLYGNTDIIANSIAEGLRDKACDVHIVPVTRATAEWPATPVSASAARPTCTA